MEKDIGEALNADLKSSAVDAYLTNTFLLINEIEYALRYMNDWAKPQRLSLALNLFPCKGYTQLEPLGVILVMGSWNYPFSTI